MNALAGDPTSRRAILVAALLGAFVIFQPSAELGEAILSILGNTVTHGLLLGAIPLLLLYPSLHDSLDSSLH